MYVYLNVYMYVYLCVSYSIVYFVHVFPNDFNMDLKEKQNNKKYLVQNDRCTFRWWMTAEPFTYGQKHQYI